MKLVNEQWRRCWGDGLNGRAARSGFQYEIQRQSLRTLVWGPFTGSDSDYGDYEYAGVEFAVGQAV